MILLAAKNQPPESGVWFGPERQREGNGSVEGPRQESMRRVRRQVWDEGSSVQLCGAALSHEVRTPPQHPEGQCLPVTACSLQKR